ncbi:MAG: type II toxin-antitoxin system HicA family toxin [Phycisphaerae bacterium]
MTSIPALNFRTLDRALRGMGFVPVPQRGSHVFYRHADGRTTTAPNHRGRDIAKPLLREILREIRVSPEESLAHL